MTTDDRVMAILERANPVPPGELVDVPVGATRYLETALEQRSEPMTVVDPTPTRTADRERPPQRRWPLIAVAASVVAILVASIALIVATRDDATVVDTPGPTTVPEAVEPTPTTVATLDATAAQAVVDEFFTAYNAGDTDAVMDLFAAGASVTNQYGGVDPQASDEPAVRSELEKALAWNHAQGEILTTPTCQLAEEQPEGGIGVLCTYQILDAVVQAVDGEPIPTRTLFVVADGAVTGMHAVYTGVDFSVLGAPFNVWMTSFHPEVSGADCCEGETRAESEQRGALRAQWAQEWASWRDAWGCTTALCYLTTDEWVAEYDSRCVALDSPDLPTGDFVVAIRLVPRPLDRESARAVSALRIAETELVGADLTDARIAELQQTRLVAMIELGIDSDCHPTVG